MERNSVVQLVSNFVVFDPIQNVLRWNKSSKSREEVTCPNKVMQYKRV